MRDDVANSRKQVPVLAGSVDSAYARTAPSLAAATPDATTQRHQAASKTCSLQMLFARTLKLGLRLWLHLVRI